MKESADKLTPGMEDPCPQSNPFGHSDDVGCYKWSWNFKVTVTKSDMIAHEIIYERYHEALYGIQDAVVQARAERKEEAREVSSEECWMFKS